MERYSLNTGWQYAEGTLRNPLMMNLLSGWKNCDLPHDVQILKERDPAAPSEDNEGWTQGAAVFYKKEFVLEPETTGDRFWLEFEGIAGICEIWVNGVFLAKHRNPYTGVLREVTALVHPGENTIQVHLDSRMKPSSRWYVGTGLYRSVWLHRAGPVSVLPGALRVITTALEGNRAQIEVRAQLSGAAEKAVFAVRDRAGRQLAQAESIPEKDRVQTTLTLEEICPWSPETPALYTVECTVIARETTDTAAVRTGFRTISVDPKRGFCLNGVPRKLHGGCVHHDLGILGAAAHPAAEHRRVRILKENGFDALRCAHNPFGPAFLEACDELGMLVVEEAFDEWVLGRTDFGLHITFEESWEQDLEDMILRDCNHPSIVMWSTGNEVEERDGSADGFAWSRRLAEKVRALDSSRPVSAAACSLFVEYTQRPGPGAKGASGNQALNMAYDAFAEGRDLWGPGTEGYFAPLDVAGYNYKHARYEYDGQKYPHRVIYGSESYPRAALQSWQAVERNPHVIGDFVWTAWDYIGETGVGRWEITDGERPGPVGYPWLLAHCGDFDLLGNKRPQSWYRDLVWKRASAPKIFCLPPQLTGRHLARLAWGWLPVQRSYTFPEAEGKPLEVHVYADADEVILLQNGKQAGTAPCTEEQEYTAVFTIPYAPGRLEVVALRTGQEMGRDVLETAGPVSKLVLTVQQEGKGADQLAFVEIEAVDEEGRPVPYADISVTLETEGGRLLALGSADPKPDRTRLFDGHTCPLFEGRALAILKPETGSTCCRVSARAEGLDPAWAEAAWENFGVPDAPVHDVRPGPMDCTLGDLMKKPAVREILRRFLGPLVDGPMAAAVQGISLKKIFAMSGGAAPDGLETALREALG